MNGVLWNEIFVYLLLVAFSVARPWLSRKNVLFGVVFGDTEIWKNEAAKSIVKRFMLASAAISVLPAAAAMLFNPASMDENGRMVLFTAAMFALLFLEAAPYILANRAMKRLKATMKNPNLVTDRIEVEIGGCADRRNRPVPVACFLPLLLPVAVTAVLAAVYYPDMPAKIATHYNAAGAADAWGTKSVWLVMTPVFSQIVLAAVLFVTGLAPRGAAAAVKGSPGAAPGYPRYRRFITLFIIAIGFISEAGLAVQELFYAGLVHSVQTGVLVTTVPSVIVTALLFIAFYGLARRKKPEGAVLDDDGRWVLGMFYFNPSDPSLFVEKRGGIGQTVNFARPAVWVILAAVILLIVCAQIFQHG